jgi:hypothetical protein
MLSEKRHVQKQCPLNIRLTRLYNPTPICDGNSFGATDRI